ncbi:uncharacterized protein LOC141837124 [Curcuma longa]|uniref:uncharacterized protein LOC141837124 n=1 Tax=Curcuma longa TaxID=136217 RepID=UPI003D9E9EB2
MKPEKQKTRGAPQSKRLSLSRLFCFNASQVNDSDGPTPTPDRETSWWSACFMVGKKRKKEKEKVVPVHSPAKSTSRSRPARAVEESRSKKSAAQGKRLSLSLSLSLLHPSVLAHARIMKQSPLSEYSYIPHRMEYLIVRSRGIKDNNNNDKSEAPSSSREASKFNEDLNNGQQNLLQTKRGDYISIAQTSFVQSSYPIQIRAEGNESRPYKIASSQSRKLGSSIGVGIMTITLAIMVFVGRGTAIICFCSCLYILHLMRASQLNDEEKITPKKIDIDSVEYKKKIILEGFLQRNGGRSLNVVRSKR